MALSVIVSAPVWLPATVGANVTAMVHLPPAATLLPHVLVCAKGAGAEIEVMLSDAVPELVRVTVWAALVVSTSCEANVRLPGVKLIPADSPVRLVVPETLAA